MNSLNAMYMLQDLDKNSKALLNHFVNSTGSYINMCSLLNDSLEFLRMFYFLENSFL